MNFLNLEYFIALVNAGNISRAATQLYVSQQTLSENLSKLEREIGTTLFTRGRQIALTPAGKRFYTFAENAICEKDRMASDIRQIIETKTKMISCGVATFEAPLFLSGLLVRFYEACPSHRITIHTQKGDDLRGDSIADMDFIFNDIDLDGNCQLSDPAWDSVCLSCNSRYAIIAKRSLLESTYGELWPEREARLLSERSLAAIHELPLCTVRNQRNLHYRTIIKAFELSGFSPNIAFQADMNGLNTDMCARGIAAYFGPEGLCKLKLNAFLNAPDLCMYSIDIPGISHGLAISYPKNRPLSEAHQTFIKLAKEFIQ